MLGKTIKKANILKLVLAIIIVTLFLMSMTSCKLVSQPRDVSGIDKVAIHGSGELIIEQGDTESLTVTAPAELLPYIETTVSGGTLTISIPDEEGDKPPITIRGVRYYLKVKDLNEISAFGSGSISSSDFVTDTIKIIIAGSSNIELSGQATSQEIEIDGSGNYSAKNFETSQCTVRINGSGNASVNVRDNLDITINGSGNVKYVGDPSVQKKQN
jgi:hypothetical protein